MANVTVDTTELKKLGENFRAGAIIALGRLGERGYQLLRKEVPKQTTNLQQGVAPPEIDKKSLTATLVVSARSASIGGGTGIIHYPSGKTKTVQIRPQKPFNYAEVVARGRPAIKPKVGKALIIPVFGAVKGGTILEFNGQYYAIRKSAGAQKANPFDERAAEQLKREAPAIVNAVFGELFN